MLSSSSGLILSKKKQKKKKTNELLSKNAKIFFLNAKKMQQLYSFSKSLFIPQSLLHLNAVPGSHVCDVIEVRGSADHLTPSVCGPVMDGVNSQEK